MRQVALISQTMRAGHCHAYMSAEDGDTVIVESPYGSAEARVAVSKRMHPEVVGLQHGFGHSALGRLAKGRGTSDTALRPTKADPLSGQAMHKQTCVRLRKV